MSRKVHIVFRLLNFLHSSASHYLNLSDLDHRVLINLASHHGEKGIFPHQATIAKELNITIRTVEKRISHLRMIGAINSSKIGRKNCYELTCIEHDKPEHMDGYSREEDQSIPVRLDGTYPSEGTGHTRTAGRVNSIYIINSDKNSIKNKRKMAEKPMESMVLPEWLAVSDWESFVTHRKEIKSPMTERAKKLMINNLVKLKSEGVNVEEAINLSIMNGWKGIFAPRKNGINNEQKIKKESYHDKLASAGKAVLQRKTGNGSIFEVPGYMGEEMGSKH